MKGKQVEFFWGTVLESLKERINDFLMDLSQLDCKVEDIKFTPIRYDDCVVLHAAVIYSKEV